MPLPGGGATNTVIQSGPAAEAQAEILRAIGPLLSGGLNTLATGTLPTAGRVTDLSRVSPDELALPGRLRANYDPAIAAFSTGAGTLARQAGEPMRDFGAGGIINAALRQATAIDPTARPDLMRAGIESIFAAPGAAAAPLAPALRDYGEQTGLSQMVRASMNMDRPIDEGAFIAPLERAFRETVAPEIRSAAMRAGSPGSSGEGTLFERAAGRFGGEAGEALSRAELARRGVGLQGLGQAASIVGQGANTELARRGLGVTALGQSAGDIARLAGLAQSGGALGLQGALGQGGQELQRRGLGITGLSAAADMAGRAATAGAVAPESAANIGALGRNLGISGTMAPFEMVLRALGGAPNPLGAPTGQTNVSRPSIGSEIGGGVGSALMLAKLAQMIFA